MNAVPAASSVRGSADVSSVGCLQLGVFGRMDCDRRGRILFLRRMFRCAFRERIPKDTQMNDSLHANDIVHTGRGLAASAHIAAVVAAAMTSWSAGIAGAAAALVVWLLVRDQSRFAAEHAKEALNFNLSMFLYAIVGSAITVVLAGATIFTLGIGVIVTLPLGIALLAVAGLLALMWLVCSVIAAIKALNGETYRYPLTVRLF